MAARRKGAAIDAPGTTEEATRLIGEYVDFEHAVTRIKAEAESRIAAIKTERDAKLAIIDEGQKGRFASLKAWWGVAGAALTDGKTKSTKLAGAELGERTSTPKLKLPKGQNEEGMMTRIMGAKLKAFLRIKFELDKPKIIAALRYVAPKADAPLPREEEEARANALGHRAWFEMNGLSVGQKEEFFIKVAPLDGTEIVADEEQGA